MLKQVEGSRRAPRPTAASAAASLATQKSAALLAEMTKKQTRPRILTGWGKGGSAGARSKLTEPNRKRIADMAKRAMTRRGSRQLDLDRSFGGNDVRRQRTAAPVVAVLAALNKDLTT